MASPRWQRACPRSSVSLAFLLASFSVVRRRLGTLFALFAAALLLESKVFPLAYEARPYALLLGLLATAFAAWQSASGPDSDAPTATRRRTLSLSLLLLSTLGMILCHVFAILPVAALIAAELHRTREIGKPDVPVLTALLLPLVGTLSYIPLLRNHGAALYPQALQPDGNTIFEFYVGSFDRQFVTLALTALAVVILLGRRHTQPSAPTQPPWWFFTAPEWTAIVALLASPLVLLLLFMHTHAAFFERYGAVEALGVGLLCTALLARWTMNQETTRVRPDPRAALLGCTIALLISGAADAIPRQMLGHNLLPTLGNSEPRTALCGACVQTAALDPAVPLVDASGLTFLEMNHHESAATLDRLFYLTDSEASTGLAHANIFEQMPAEVRAFHLRARSVPYRSFVHQYPRFFVLGKYDYPEDWLLRQLQADGASIRVLGRTDDSYRDKELYEVTFAHQP